MSVLPDIAAFADDLTALRHDFHRHPEIGFQEHRTAARIADLLRGWGVEVTTGIGGTGVVGVLEGSRPGRTIGLRSDMDALPMEERTNLPYASVNPGVFHGCGHDGHMTMLLGAARYLAQRRDFAGRAVFIFQPAEEGLGGARAMLADGLFDRFPCDELYGLHNSPYSSFGRVSVRPGPAQAGAGFFDITITGQGAHGAMPQMSRDPVPAAGLLIGALQQIVARRIDPNHQAVVSVTQMQAGSAYNVIPDRAVLSGTTRFFHEPDEPLIVAEMEAACEGVARICGLEVALDHRHIFSVLRNDPERTADLIAVAQELLGDQAQADAEPTMGSEDMADLLAVVPGAFFNLGHGSGVPLHNPGFVLDDAILPVGASLHARIVERRGAA